MSYWSHRKPVRRTRSIDVDDVARTSAELLDTGGVRALTLRSVAQRLDVAPASLYSRVESVEDLFDLALDDALAHDPHVQAALAEAPIRVLMLAFYRHLLAHPWAGQVIGMRAPRGPAYVRLSERMCVLLVELGARDPLGVAYRLSNFVIGSALTTPMAADERVTPIDPEVAPTYARLHSAHGVAPESIVVTGLEALLRYVSL